MWKLIRVELGSRNTVLLKKQFATERAAQSHANRLNGMYAHRYGDGFYHVELVAPGCLNKPQITKSKWYVGDKTGQIIAPFDTEEKATQFLDDNWEQDWTKWQGPA